MRCESATPVSIEEDVFSNIPSTATLYVPTGSKNAYANATGWNSFTNIVEVDATSGLEGVESDNTEVEYYTLQGVQVAIENLEQGIYIKKQGNKTEKVFIK